MLPMVGVAKHGLKQLHLSLHPLGTHIHIQQKNIKALL